MATTSDEDLEALRTEISGQVPPETILEAFRSGKKPSDAMLGAALILADKLAPAFLETIERAAADDEPDEDELSFAFYALHVLGAARDARAFPGLMRILRLPGERLDRFLGDGLTMTIKRVAIGTFDGQTDELYTLIAERNVDEYARYEMLMVLVFLAFEGRIDAGEAKRFLIRFDEERLAPAQDIAWCGWETAIALLGLRDLVPRVEAAWSDGRTLEGFSAPKYFFADLTRAEEEWSNPERFRESHGLGYIEDIAAELSWIALPRDRNDGGFPDDQADPIWPIGKPYINPMRHVGRNDPCPCGSGKKAKRCCLDV